MDIAVERYNSPMYANIETTDEPRVYNTSIGFVS